MNIDEILGNVSNAANVLTEVENKLFQVVKKPLIVDGDEFINPNENFAIYKNTGGAPLSIMGKQFEPMQPHEFLDSIVNTVHECGANLDLNTLEFKEFNGGKNIEFSVKLEPLAFTNNAGRYDETQNRLIFSTSYDGSKTNSISLYTWRQICTNGMMGWGMDSALKGKNTVGGKSKILLYCNEVVKIITETKDFNAKMLGLNNIKIDAKKVESFKLQLLGYNKETLLQKESNVTKAMNILDRIDESIALEFERTGETAYGLLQGITHYTNHVANTSKTISDEEFIKFHNGAKLNNTAQRLMLAELN